VADPSSRDSAAFVDSVPADGVAGRFVGVGNGHVGRLGWRRRHALRLSEHCSTTSHDSSPAVPKSSSLVPIPPLNCNATTLKEIER
jgi:hypothetical protein